MKYYYAQTESKLYHMASYYAMPTSEVYIGILVRSLYSILKSQTPNHRILHKNTDGGGIMSSTFRSF